MQSETAIFQLVAYVALTLASVIVALLSSLIAYRNNFGWKPIAIVTGWRLSGKGGDAKKFVAGIPLEIWNRQKYPIVVRSVFAQFSNITLGPFDYTKSPKWHPFDNGVLNTDEHAIGPQSHEKHEIETPFTADSIDALSAPVKIVIRYYDPRSNKHKKIVIDTIYTLGKN